MTMDPTELRMNLSSLQRIDPYITKIVFSASNVALYDYDDTQEWVETKVSGTFFVYERKCEPYYGFLILNMKTPENWIQPVSSDIELQDKHPFLLYKNKDSIHGIWFYEEQKCSMAYSMLSKLVDKVSSGVAGDQGSKQQGHHQQQQHQLQQQLQGNKGQKSQSNGTTLADMLSNAGTKGKQTNKPKASPSGGEKLLRLLSSNPEDPPQVGNTDTQAVTMVNQNRNKNANVKGGGNKSNKKSNPKTNANMVEAPSGNSVAAFFAQASQHEQQGGSVSPAGLLPGMQGLMAQQPKPEPPNPLQSLLENSAGGLPPLPPTAKSALDLESENVNINGNNLAKKLEPEPPQLLSPMVFGGTGSAPRAPQPVVTSTPMMMMMGMNSTGSPLLNGGGLRPPMMHPMGPQVTPLTQEQLVQAFNHLLRTDPNFIGRLHQAYVESLNTKLH